jgi:hypothetical protein
MRSPAAVERKFERAFAKLPVSRVHFSPYAVTRWGVMEMRVFFRYRDVDLRFDWSMDLLHDPLPKVGELRELVWTDIEDTTARLRNGFPL